MSQWAILLWRKLLPESGCCRWVPGTMFAIFWKETNNTLYSHEKNSWAELYGLQKNSFEWEFRKRFHNNSIKFLGPIVEGSICNPFWIQPTRAFVAHKKQPVDHHSYTCSMCMFHLCVYRNKERLLSCIEMTIFSNPQVLWLNKAFSRRTSHLESNPEYQSYQVNDSSKQGPDSWDTANFQ